jgi:hypothetical protein
MSTFADIEVMVLDRIEEDRISPRFWSLQDEIRVFLVEALNELTLITGEPEFRSGSLFNIPANQTIHDLPADCLTLLRIESANPVTKTFLHRMDQFKPGWQADVIGAGEFVSYPNEIQHWFPIGLTKFGVWPKLNAAIDVTLHYVQLPVTAARPYLGTTAINLREEFREALADYSHHVSCLKEGGPEFEQSLAAYDRFLARASELSKLAWRKDALRFTKSMGSPVRVAEVIQR